MLHTIFSLVGVRETQNPLKSVEREPEEPYSLFVSAVVNAADQKQSYTSFRLTEKLVFIPVMNRCLESIIE